MPKIRGFLSLPLCFGKFFGPSATVSVFPALDEGKRESARSGIEIKNKEYQSSQTFPALFR